jgi:hypothetical protein
VVLHFFGSIERMFGEFETYLREHGIAPEADALARAFALRDVFDARLAAAVAAFDARRSFEAEGAVSTDAWLRSRCRRTRRDATRLVRTARAVAGWPALHDAWTAGDVSSGQVDVVVANVGRHAGRFAEHEAAVVPALGGLGIDATTAAMRAWRAKADALDDGPAPDDLPGRLHLSRTLDGRGELRGSLDADTTEVVEVALRTAMTADLTRSLAERRADALGEICHQFLDAGGRAHNPRHRRHRPHVNVVVAYETLAAVPEGRYVEGPPVTAARLGALLCDANIHRVVTQGRSTVLDYGRATRTIPVDLFNTLVLRDQGCRWPGCDRPAAWCDGHHLQPWHQGGATSLDNIVLCCRRHHHRLHQTGWHVKLLPDATLEVTHPDGTTHTSAPPGPVAQEFW